MQIDEEGHADPDRETGIGANDLEKIKAQIIAQCRDMFHKLMDEQRER